MPPGKARQQNLRLQIAAAAAGVALIGGAGANLRIAILDLQQRKVSWFNESAGIEAFDVETEDSGRFLVVRITFGGQTYEKRLQLGTVIYRGVYSNGMKAMMGDSVTFGGNYWTAMEDTEDKPGDSPAWKLVVRRGRDGKDGKDGKSYVDNSPS